MTQHETVTAWETAEGAGHGYRAGARTVTGEGPGKGSNAQAPATAGSRPRARGRAIIPLAQLILQVPEGERRALTKHVARYEELMSDDPRWGVRYAMDVLCGVLLHLADPGRNPATADILRRQAADSAIRMALYAATIPDATLAGEAGQ
jgi:hypothetical protein